MSRVSAQMPLPHLMAMLSRRGWGPLAGREWQGVRSTLRAVVERVPWRSGQGRVLLWDITESAGLSDRWVRRCLGVLDELGVIEWWPGGIAHGRPQPSWVRINKSVLVDLIRIAQPGHDKRLLAYRAAVAARLATLRAPWIQSKRARNRPPLGGLEAQSELSATPTPGKGEEPTATSSRESNSSSPRKENRVPLPQINTMYLPQRCAHKDPRGPKYCALCRAAAMSPDQWAEWEAEHGPQPRLAPSAATAASREEALAIMRAVAARAAR